jgi:hypothetical protein
MKRYVYTADGRWCWKVKRKEENSCTYTWNIAELLYLFFIWAETTAERDPDMSETCFSPDLLYAGSTALEYIEEKVLQHKTGWNYYYKNNNILDEYRV